jgi:REP element-mobilizing transposase RayT
MNSREAIHLVMRSSWAKGTTSFRNPANKNKIESLIRTVAVKHQVLIYRKAVVGNHIHLVLKVADRRAYCAFVRSVSGQIARHVMRKQSFKNFIKQLRGDGGAQAKKKRRFRGKTSSSGSFDPGLGFYIGEKILKSAAGMWSTMCWRLWVLFRTKKQEAAMDGFLDSGPARDL